MQYNIHNEKYRLSDIGGIKREQFREYSDSSMYKNKVNPDRTKDNYYQEMVPEGKQWFQHIKEAQDSTRTITGRAVRRDAVVLCSTIETVPDSWDNETCITYFKDKAAWYGEYLQTVGGADEGCLKSLAVHLDETSPHATYAWIPLKEGRLQAKNIVNHQFLRRLQEDSQQFTFSWIDAWNNDHPERTIERLEPYVPGSEARHLTEAEFKEKKIEEHVTELQKELEQTVVEITRAPDLPSYNQIVEEKEQLAEKVSFRDRIIEGLKEKNSQLQESADYWKRQASDWKMKFSDITHKAGEKLMHFFGYDVSGEENMRPYPSREISEGFNSLSYDARKVDPKAYHVIPDNENSGHFRVVHRTREGNYETVKGNFSSRQQAETWKKDVQSGVNSLTDEFIQKNDRHRTK